MNHAVWLVRLMETSGRVEKEAPQDFTTCRGTIEVIPNQVRKLATGHSSGNRLIEERATQGIYIYVHIWVTFYLRVLVNLDQIFVFRVFN